MNWTVRRMVTLTQKHIDEADEVCEHLKVGDQCYSIGEQDSFGPVTRFYECAECHEKSLEEEEQELVFCNDCGKEHPRKETTEWRWYDFYAPQGDTPLTICDSCWKASKHQQRMARDAADEEREFGSDRY